MSDFRSTCFRCFCVILLATVPDPARAQKLDSVSMMPLPFRSTQGEGEFVIDGSFGIKFTGYTEPRLERARQRFLDLLSRETGIPLWREARDNRANFIVHTDGPSDLVQQVGEDESYRLTIAENGVQLSSANPLGALRGLQTFLQLERVTPRGFSVPVITIDDRPRFPWRGLLIDSGHRFVRLPVIERNLDAMEAVKLNVLHLRFADDAGFHLESKRFPLLQEKASGGFYYTQKEVKEIIVYARDRGIRVMPEFDMPCHTASWFRAYPDLGSGHIPSESSAMDPTRASTYKFLSEFIEEMASLFPDAYFHTGGDECDFHEWASNPRIQEYMRVRGIKDGTSLQSQFTSRIQAVVARNRKIMMGWDEVLQPSTPQDVVIQSWRGPKSLMDAARHGNRGVLSSGYYIDLNESAAEHYAVDPLDDPSAASLTPEERARVLGGEATMWTDIVSDENLDGRVWPRTAAIAERLWSSEDARDINSMYRRLDVVSQKLGYYGVRHRLVTEEMLERMSGDPDPVALRVLADVVQPPKGYQRQDLRNFGDFTPLNRMDDAVPPESDTARVFDGIARRIAEEKATREDWEQAQQWLVLWRDNDTRLQPLLARSALTQNLAPVSRNLSAVATIGLQALDDLKSRRVVDTEVRNRNIEFLETAAKPQAVLLLMVAQSVETLVKATRTQ